MAHFMFYKAVIMVNVDCGTAKMGVLAVVPRSGGGIQTPSSVASIWFENWGLTLGNDMA
jgi:hypothetical protein